MSEHGGDPVCASGYAFPKIETEDSASFSVLSEPMPIASATQGSAVVKITAEPAFGFTWETPANTAEDVQPSSSENQWNYALEKSEASDGNGILAWIEVIDGVPAVFFVEYVDGDWGQSVPIQTAPTIQMVDVQCGVAESGDAFISYTQEDGNGIRRIYVSEKVAGVWTHPTSIESFILPYDYNVGNYSAKMNSSGDIMIAFTARIDGVQGSNALYRIERINGVWQPVSEKMSLNTETHYSYCQLAFADNGDAIIVYSADTKDMYACYKLGSAWHIETDPLNTVNQYDARDYQLVISENHRGAMIYMAKAISDLTVPIATLFESTGFTKRQDPILDAGFSGYTSGMNARMVANGDIYLIYQYSTGSGNDAAAFGKYVWDAGTSSVLRTIEGTNAAQAEVMKPYIDINKNGNGAIVYVDLDDGENYAVFAIRKDSDDNFYAPVSNTDNLSPDGTYAKEPKVSVSSDGSAIAAWKQVSVEGMYELFVANTLRTNDSLPVTDTVDVKFYASNSELTDADSYEEITVLANTISYQSGTTAGKYIPLPSLPFMNLKVGIEHNSPRKAKVGVTVCIK